MLGSLMMFATGVRASAPSQVSSSGICWSSLSRSGNVAMIRPAREMSCVSNSTPVPLAYARTMGSSEQVASAGASSTFVQMILADDMTLPGTMSGSV